MICLAQYSLACINSSAECVYHFMRWENLFVPSDRSRNSKISRKLVTAVSDELDPGDNDFQENEFPPHAPFPLLSSNYHLTFKHDPFNRRKQLSFIWLIAPNDLFITFPSTERFIGN